jgi:putative inorganic carbon (HCO3(-)) transporter
MGALTQNQLASNPAELAMGSGEVSARHGYSRGQPLAAAFLGLLTFMFVYFARPEDWVPGLSQVPLAKLTGILALVALACSISQFRQRIPREVFYLFLLVVQLFVSSLFSPIWRGGSMAMTLDFGKLLLIVPLIIGTVTTSRRLSLLLFSQAVSVAAIAAVVIWKGHLQGGRLEGILGGNYNDPNDLALAIILSLPFCLVLMFLSRTVIKKAFWSVSMIVMAYAVFLTGSRGGFAAFIVVVAICLWEFAIRGRRRYLLLLVAAAGMVLWQFAGGNLDERLRGTFDPNDESGPAYASAQDRQQLFWRSIEITKEHPLFGVGPGNFPQVSGLWHTTHNSLTLLSSEAGIPALVLYVMILWAGFRNLRAAMRLTRGQRESSILVRGIYASFCGYLVGSLFLSWAYLFLPYILVAYTTPLLSIARKSLAQGKKSESFQKAKDEKRSTMPSPADELCFSIPSNSLYPQRWN